MSGLMAVCRKQKQKGAAMNKKLLITLKSDLCAATGDGFSLGVDIDVCLDKFGLPYIPGRRLKGCLRDAASDIGSTYLADIFGVPGDSKPGSIVVGNATLPNAKDLGLIAESEGFTTAAVSSLFTQVRAQTAIENDSVKDGSLRFIRVVNHYSPLDKTELMFEATLSFNDEYELEVERCVKALRNIGYHRNRGFGAVKCALVNAEDNEKTDLPSAKHFAGGFAYAVKLDTPLMIPKQGDDSLPYIPGSSVMGAFAAKLSNALSSEEFEHAFLRDEVRFSPLYPVSSKNRTLPAFGLLAKIKGAKPGARDGEIVNLFRADFSDGEQPKPLKNGFVDAGCFAPIEVETEITYHHSTGAATEDDATLYTQECLSAGQVFAGYITGSTDMLRCFESILKTESISFGRSKTAQYSRCSLVNFDGDLSAFEDEVAAGEVVALLDSDVLLADGYAGYSNDARKLAEALADALGEPADSINLDGSSAKSSVKYRIVSGYNSKWNQKKPHVRAFAAGSFFVVNLSKSAPKSFFIGERQNEGFGHIILIPLSAIEPGKISPNESREIETDLDSPFVSKWRELLLKNELAEQLKQDALSCADEARKLKSASFVGRVLLMIEQSENANDLDERIRSIKSEQKRVAVQDVLRHARDKFPEASWELEKEALLTLFADAKYYIKAQGGSND